MQPTPTPLTAATLQPLLHSYRWPELWQAVRHLQPEPGAQRTPSLAIKAMLLVGWWQEAEQAQACVAAYPGRITDPNKKQIKRAI